MASSIPLTSAIVEKKLRAGEYRLSEASDTPGTHNRQEQRSDVWKYFRRIRTVEGAEVTGFVACHTCKHCYAYDSKGTGSTSLMRHIKLCKPQPNQISMQKAFGMVISKSAKESIIKASVAFVCQDIRPFYAVEGEGMRKLADSLIGIGAKFGAVKADAVMPSANTIKNQTLKLANEHRECLKKTVLQESLRGCISFTTDLWTDDYRKIAYMDLSASLVNSELEMDHHVLACQAFPEERKTAANILAAIHDIFEVYGIEQYLQASWFTTDKGSNIVAALKDCKRLDCMAHRLNTVLRTAWDDTEKVNDNAKHLRTACLELVRFAKKGNLQQKLKSTLKAEAPTRWNSFYFTLQSILDNFQDLHNSLMNTSDFRRLAIIDVDLVKELVDLLKIFKKITDVLEAEYCPTLQNVVLSFYTVKNACKPNPRDSNVVALLKGRISDLITEKVHLEDVHWVAVYLDPSTKPLPMLSAMEKGTKMLVISSYLKSQEYPISRDEPTEYEPRSKSPKLDIFEQLRAGAPMETAPIRGSVEEEMSTYENLATEHHSNPLNFWKIRQKTFPKLSLAASRVFAISATSAQSERTFSSAGRVIDDRRTRLKPDTLDAILRVRSYLKSGISPVD